MSDQRDIRVGMGRLNRSPTDDRNLKPYPNQLTFDNSRGRTQDSTGHGPGSCRCLQVSLVQGSFERCWVEGTQRG